jgi:hypothetical protein
MPTLHGPGIKRPVDQVLEQMSKVEEELTKTEAEEAAERMIVEQNVKECKYTYTRLSEYIIALSSELVLANEGASRS